MHLVRIQERKNTNASVNNSQVRAKKARAHAAFTEAISQAERSIRIDNKYVEDAVVTVKKDVTEGSMRQLCDTTKKLAGNYSTPRLLVKNKEGEKLL
ncbi:unnamed protein product [Schistosoma margrebowiei]|uniref:Uncharacterized protein n=1 Tax=Schistosoma margrebowiei TaxID=48269 RepID=A0A183MQN9_9TREM|nr:unnamed protein product [Schistosoma margrebowiei]